MPSRGDPDDGSDGSNLAAVLATLIYIRRDTVDLDSRDRGRFPGARLDVPLPGQEGVLWHGVSDHPRRVFEARELFRWNVALSGARRRPVCHSGCRHSWR